MLFGALDIGGTKTIAALVDASGKIVARKKFLTFTQNCFTHLDRCVDSMQRLLNEVGCEAAALSGLGVTLPGLVDIGEGVLLRAPYANWENISAADYLSERLGVRRVACENDVNACAMGELRFGLGSKYSDFIWMTVSTGVGGACVSEGKLLHGAQGFAGELGHLKVEYEHPERCPCGQEGCLEAHGSGTALNRRIERAAESDPGFRAAFAQEGLPINAEACAKLCRSGNAHARQIFDQTGKYLGRGMAYCVNILNPQAIIVGGGVAASLDLMLDGIQRELAADAFSSMNDVDVVATPLGYEAALLGAASLVIGE